MRGRLDSHPHDLLPPPTPGPLPLPNRPHRPAVQGIKPRSLTERPRRDPTNPLGSTSARRVASHNRRPSPPKRHPRRTGLLPWRRLLASSAGLPGLPNGSQRLPRRRGLRKRRPRPRRRNRYASPQRQPVPPRRLQRMRPGRRPAPRQHRAPLAPRRPRTHLCQPPRAPRRRRVNLPRAPPSGQVTRTSGAAGPGICAASPHRDAQGRPNRRHRRGKLPRSARTSTASANRSRA